MSTTYSVCPECLKVNRIPVSGARGSQAPVCGACKLPLPIHGMINELSAPQLRALAAKSPLPVVVDFWAPWCGPCRAFAPVFEQAAARLGDRFVFAKVNTEAHPGAADAYGIRGIPTLAVFRQGVELGRQSGAMPLPVLLEWLRASMPSETPPSP